MSSISSWTDGDARAADRALHCRLVAGDPTAPTDLAERYLGPLLAWLRRCHPREDDALLSDIATDLILDLGERPERYDADKRSLTGYLRMAANRDVLNARQSEHRRVAHLAPLARVELQPPARNSTQAGTSDPADTVADAPDDERIRAMRTHFNDRDWAVAELQLEGERSTARYAAVLGLADRPEEEQKREVKRAKDRVKKRLQRVWRTLTGND